MGVVGEMVALGGGWRRGCAALLELRKRLSEERERERKRESTLVLFCNERKRKEDDAERMCVEVGSVSVSKKQRKVLRILLSTRGLSPRAVSCSVLPLAYLLVFSPGLR